MNITRRDTIAMIGSAALPTTEGGAMSRSGNALTNFIPAARNACGYVIPSDAPADNGSLVLTTRWHGEELDTVLENRGAVPVAVKQIVVWDVAHRFPSVTEIYGEGFTMLSTTSGTLAAPVWENYRDAIHYRIPEPAGALTAYGVALLTPPEGDRVLIGILSSSRFVGTISVWPDRLRVAFDAEDLVIAPSERWALDPIVVMTGAEGGTVLSEFAGRMARLNMARAGALLHTGWSSWNALGADLHFGQVLDNAQVVATRAPMLDYIQIDDGYQGAMGDWFETRPGFGGSMADLCTSIARLGKKPAVWVAPLIAERNSNVFRDHPEWFIEDSGRQPLGADKVTFAGWRNGPWYGIDGSHPGACDHLEQMFRRMRGEWGVDYFKLDALFWGAMPGGFFHNPRVSRVEAYRSALAAIRRGAGDAFITVANAPLWPTVGFADASRASNDVHSSWSSFKQVGRQNLRRSWMHRRLWVTDPDSFMLGGDATNGEFRAHWTSVYISGGIFLIGDDLTRTLPERLDVLRRLGRPTGFRPRVADGQLEFVTTDGGPMAVFNWGDEPKAIRLAGSPRSRWRDFWTSREFVLDGRGFASAEVASRDALLLHRL